MNALITGLTRSPWALQLEVLEGLHDVVLRHARGEKLPEGEIRQIVAMRGDDDGESPVTMVGSIAVIPIEGIISKHMSAIGRASHLGTSTGEIQKNLRAALDNPNVAAIVLDIDSPGGNIAGIAETANMIRKASKSKPIVAFANDTTASAAYWLAAQANEIVASMTAHVGSIGVYMVTVDSSEAFEREGFKVEVIKSGEFKGVGERGVEITDAHKTELQKGVNAVFDVFLNHVAEGRDIPKSQLKDIADGRVFIGKEAQKVGLIDRIGNINDAIAAAGRLATSRTGAKLTENHAYMKGTNVMLTDQKLDAPDAQQKQATSPPVATQEATAVDMKAATQAGIKAERDRIVEITAISNKLGFDEKWVKKQIESETVIEDIRKDALDKYSEGREPVDVKVGEDLNRSTIGQAILDSIMLRAGSPVEKPHERTLDFRGCSLIDLARAHLEAWGANLRGMTRADVAKLAFQPNKYMAIGGTMAAGGGVYGHSTSDFPLILENAVNKRLAQGYQETPHTWDAWMRRVTLPDFKEAKVNRLAEHPNLPLVAEGGEYTYATIGEEQEKYVLAKYGKLFDLTWETIINDDLNAFSRLPQLMGAASSRLVNTIAYTPITGATDGEDMSDGAALFHANHNNLAASAAVISITSLGLARKAMRTQTGITAGVKINVPPTYLIVPAALEVVAEQLISSLVDPTKSNATPNPFANKLQIITEPLLDAHDANAWYLAGKSSQIDTIEVAFLEGHEAPFLEQQDGMSVDGRRYKVRMVVAAKAIDWRGLYKNAGA